MKEILIIRSSVTSYLQKTILFRGCAIASVGIAIFLFAGSYLPIERLDRWGWILFPISLGLITLGMLPYRRLLRLQLKPDQLILSKSNEITFSHREIALFTISLESIARIDYEPNPASYGILIWFKKASIQPIRIHQKSTITNKLQVLGLKMGNADLFLPYFNQRGYEELIEWRNEDVEQVLRY